MSDEKPPVQVTEPTVGRSVHHHHPDGNTYHATILAVDPYTWSVVLLTDWLTERERQVPSGIGDITRTQTDLHHIPVVYRGVTQVQDEKLGRWSYPSIRPPVMSDTLTEIQRHNMGVE